jgi:hypothetical protein
MKIAIATKDWQTVSGHAGQARCWLIYDLAPGLNRGALPAPERVELAKDQVLHHFRDEGPHPLDGVEVVVAGGADPHSHRRSLAGSALRHHNHALQTARLVLAALTAPAPLRTQAITAIFVSHSQCNRY